MKHTCTHSFRATFFKTVFYSGRDASFPLFILHSYGSCRPSDCGGGQDRTRNCCVRLASASGLNHWATTSPTIIFLCGSCSESGSYSEKVDAAAVFPAPSQYTKSQDCKKCFKIRKSIIHFVSSFFTWLKIYNIYEKPVSYMVVLWSRSLWCTWRFRIRTIWAGEKFTSRCGSCLGVWLP
jgi:hypothetical protein